MFLEETKAGTATDLNGVLSMVVKPGTYTAVFAYMGLETVKYFIEVLSDGEFTVEQRLQVRRVPCTVKAQVGDLVSEVIPVENAPEQCVGQP